MEQSTPKKRNWLGCGLIGLAVVCIGTMVALGGFTALLALVGWAAEESTPAAPSAGTTPAVVEQPAPSSASTDPTPLPLNTEIPFQAVVQIIALYEYNGRLEMGWTGSGSMISPDGLILTNAHVVLPDRYYAVDALAIAFTTQEDQPPVARYYAEVLQADEALDIAVLRITMDSNGNPVNHASLNLPYVELGNADNLRLGDSITILGYPGIGGETITLTRGEVSGFTSEAGRGDRAFIKTSATIAGGNSGGLAASPDGTLIGIPTQLGYGGDDQFVDCRVLADTNRDGEIDDRDNCIPTGGFINALRPINLAIPLIEAAQGGIVNLKGDTAPAAEIAVPNQGGILFQDDFSSQNSNWGTWQDEDGAKFYSNDKFQIKVSQDNYLIWAVSLGQYSDVLVTVDAEVVASTGDADYGLICRYQDPDNFYGLEVSEDGYYSIWKYEDGEFSNLTEWKQSSDIPTGSGKRDLTAICVGDSLALAINGKILAEVSDSSFSQGDVGILVGTLDTGGAQVSFDNIIVSDSGP